MSITHLFKRHKKLPLKKCVYGFIDQSDDAKNFIFLKDWITASQMLVELSWRPNFDLITTCQSGESIRRSTLRKQTSFSSFLEPYAVRPQLNRPDIISRVHILKMNPVACPNQKSKNYWKECLWYFLYQNNKFEFIQEGRLILKINLLPPTTKQQLDLLRFNGLLA